MESRGGRDCVSRGITKWNQHNGTYWRRSQECEMVVYVRTKAGDEPTIDDIRVTDFV